MKYVPPVGGADNDPYIDGNPSTGVEGSAVPAAAIEDPMRELSGLIAGVGLVPDDADLTQVSKAVRMAIQQKAGVIALAGGTADAIAAVFTPAITSLTHGMTLHVRAGSANATTTPTFTPAAGTIAAKTIVKGNNLPLVAGDIAGAGYWSALRYDNVLDKWVLLNPAVGIATVTTANDPTFADNSAKPASTGWIRSALSAIATAAGFVFNAAQSGYIKFPSWLGGWIVQWGASSAITSGSNQAVTLPITFPNAILGSVVCVGGSVNLSTNFSGQVALTSNSAITIYHYSTGGNAAYRHITVGW